MSELVKAFATIYIYIRKMTTNIKKQDKLDISVARLFTCQCSRRLQILCLATLHHPRINWFEKTDLTPDISDYNSIVHFPCLAVYCVSLLIAIINFSSIVT